MRKDINEYYRALGIAPGAEPAQIRRAYRQLVQQWHPDLFKAGSPMQTTAEDITKEINEAYDQLYRKKLYRNFSPKSERKENAPPPVARNEFAREDTRATGEKRPAGVPKAKKPARPARRKSAPWTSRVRRFKWPRWARIGGLSVAALAAVVLGRMIVGYLPSWSPAKVASSESRPQGPTSQRQAAVRTPVAQERPAPAAPNRPALASVHAYLR